MNGAQKPTVGRIVHYYPPISDLEYLRCAEHQPIAAIVTEVFDDTDWIRLRILTPYPLTDVSANMVTANFAEGPTPGCWSWPPRV